MEKRIEWIDLGRVLAISFVMACHATEGIYKMNADYLPSLAWPSRLFAVVTFSVGRLGVPIFLMISGYLLLDRIYNDDKCIRFWKYNWLRLLSVTELWIVIYNIFLCMFNSQKMDLRYLIEDLLFLHKVDMGHIWYMPMILGMYILFPYVANALSSINIRHLTFPLLMNKRMNEND